MSLFNGILICVQVSLLTQFSWAHEHRESGAHVHGAAHLDIAFDGTKGKVELHGAGDSFIGFEHEAITPADKKTQNQALDILETKIAEMVVFETGLKCTFLKDKVELNHEEGAHSDIEAIWSITCQSSVVGSRLTINIQKFFPRVKDLDLQVLADSIQLSAESRQSGTVINIKAK